MLPASSGPDVARKLAAPACIRELAQLVARAACSWRTGTIDGHPYRAPTQPPHTGTTPAGSSVDAPSDVLHTGDTVRMRDIGHVTEPETVQTTGTATVNIIVLAHQTHPSKSRARARAPSADRRARGFAAFAHICARAHRIVVIRRARANRIAWSRARAAQLHAAELCNRPSVSRACAC